MSESMPIMANTAGLSQSKEALVTGGAESTTASGDFTELLDSQLQLAEEDVSAFPTELLSTTDEVELLTTVPAPGNELPLTAATPEPSAITALPVILPENSTAASLQVSRQATSAKPVSISNINTGVELNSGTAVDDALNSNEVLMARQQQQLMQMGTGSKESTLFESALNHQLADEPAAQPGTSSSLNNMLNSAGLAAGMTAKADAVPGQTPAPLNVPPQHPGWNQSVGDRLQWMIGQNLQTAEIRLDPPELGSMEVRIQIHKDNASIVFSAPNPQVRDALEAAIPRLREMMDQIGLSLGDVNVSQESFTQKQQDDDSGAATGRMSASDNVEIDGLEAISSAIPQRGQGLLDAYA